MREQKNNFDYSGYATEPTNQDSALAELSKLAERQADAENEVKRLQDELQSAQANLVTISQRLIPEAMEALNLEEFKTTTGLKIKVKESIQASIKEADKPVAYQWFRDNGYGAMLKRIVSVEFGMGEDEVAETVSQELSSEYEVVIDKVSIHHSTLKSFVKDRLEAGEELPLELLGVHRQRVAVID